MVMCHLKGNGLYNQGRPVFPVITLTAAIPVCYAFICHMLNSASSVDQGHSQEKISEGVLSFREFQLEVVVFFYIFSF